MKILIAILLAVSSLVHAKTFIERMGQPDKVGHYVTGTGALDFTMDVVDPT